LTKNPECTSPLNGTSQWVIHTDVRGGASGTPDVKGSKDTSTQTISLRGLGLPFYNKGLNDIHGLVLQDINRKYQAIVEMANIPSPGRKDMGSLKCRWM
jgi:hypothetical protein